LVKIVEQLRKGCPWDREQTIESLKPYLVEEVYEAIQAIDDRDYKQLAEELGDMLLHVVMLSVFAREKRYFDVNDVINAISAKMVRRHPHVFSTGNAKTKEDVWRKWEIIKRKEQKAKGKKQKGMLDSIPRSLPALYRADKVQNRAARVGFDWDYVAGAWNKVHEELDEIHQLLNPNLKLQTSKQLPRHKRQRIKEELGDLFFAVVNVARKLDFNAEEVLQEANAKFLRRFSRIERQLRKKKLTIEEMDAIWEKTKASEH
jgi:tetrapyrrole methylase family protein/MazG family protein